MARLAELRERCVAGQVAGRGVTDPRVLAAMRAVPRELFVPTDVQAYAYEDRPLEIGFHQTISQPYIVGYMIATLQLTGGERVLEIGAGSGYASAVLAAIVREVYAIERIGSLAAMARDNLDAAGVANVEVRHADGTAGWPEAAPFDAILVSAGAPRVPPTLFDQLSAGGRMVVPVGSDERTQDLVRVTKGPRGEMASEVLTGVRFVPLIGKEGFEEQR